MISEKSSLNIPFRKTTIQSTVNTHLPNQISDVEISSSSDEEDKQHEVSSPEVPNQMKNSEESSPSTRLSPFSLTFLKSNFRFELQYKVRSNFQKPNIFSKEYEKYLIEIIINIPDDEKREIMGDSLVAHSDLLEQVAKETKKCEIKDEKKIAEVKCIRKREKERLMKA